MPLTPGRRWRWIVSMRNLLVALCALSGFGCSYQRMDEIVIDSSLPDAEIEMIESAAELWFSADESLRIPVRISDSGANVRRGDTPGMCPRVLGWVDVSQLRKPTVYLCDDNKQSVQTVAHELGHAIAGRDDHTERRNTMMFWESAGLPKIVTEDDLLYIRNQRER